MSELRVDVWSDIACPWCWVGKRRLEAALARFPHRESVRLVWRSFELDPSAPRSHDTGLDYVARLARKYGASPAQAKAMLDRMTATAAGEGLDMRFERIRPGNTFDAHRLLHLAHERGLQDALKERLFRAYFTEGEPIGDPAALARLAAEVGLDAAEVERVLAGDAHARAVREDQSLARELGIQGVPFFVFDGRHAVSGAHPAETLLAALTTAWTDAEGRGESAAEGAACGPDGCA